MWLALLGLGSWTWDQDLSQVPEQALLEPIPCGGIPDSSLTHGKGFGPTSTFGMPACLDSSREASPLLRSDWRVRLKNKCGRGRRRGNRVWFVK